MNANLPPIGRPSLTGLSAKQMGRANYVRQWRALRHPLIQPQWTGLSLKQLGSAAYQKLRRQLMKEKQ